MLEAMPLLADLYVRMFVWMCVYVLLLAGMALIVSKIVPRMPNKASRFVVLFVLGVPFSVAYGYSKYWPYGHSKMSWTEALIVALPGSLISAILCTFWGPASEGSRTH
ncbi:MAG TPA: hypothetical protein VKR59_18105 [Terriglobales bacterium]|nr:hypothetical protein [Terriglobales bacterium]